MSIRSIDFLIDTKVSIENRLVIVTDLLADNRVAGHEKIRLSIERIDLVNNLVSIIKRINNLLNDPQPEQKRRRIE